MVPAAINPDNEIKKDKKPVIQSNFAERYDIAFKSFTTTHPWNIIIREIHGRLAKSNSDRDIKSEE